MAIKKLQNNFTTPEQSKRLLELGVPADSADCYYFNWNKRGNLPQIFPCNKVKKHSFNDRIGIKNIIPCWSVGRLVEIYGILCNVTCVFSLNTTEIIDDIIDSIVRSKNYLDFSKLEDWI